MKTIVSFIFLLLAAFSFAGNTEKDQSPVKKAITYQVKKCKGINTTGAEFCPVINGDELVFVSDRERDPISFGENRWKQKKQLNLFSAVFTLEDDSVSFSKTVAYRKGLTDQYHEGPICFHPAETYAVVARVVDGQRYNRPQLYLVKKKKGQWSKPVRLPFCKKEFSYSHACFSEDGKTLYFSSDQPGTLGGKDLFSCSFDQGEFGEPVNLGGKINSTKNEMFPFIRSGILYFSSDQEGTLGGMDIFTAALEEGKFAAPVNAGSSINTVADEYSFYLSSSGHEGFFASNRTNNNDDVYFFTVYDPNAPVEVSGNFAYARLRDDYPGGLGLQLLNEEGGVVRETRTDEKGTFRFEKLPPGHQYSLNVLQPAEGLVLQVRHENGQQSVLMSDGRGLFVYKKLEEETGTLELMQQEEAGIGKQQGSISGRFVHERLKDAPMEGIKVMLVDEAGNVYARTVTDEKGNFSFDRLPADQDFHVFTTDHSDDLKLMIYNNRGEITAELKRRGYGPFVFRRMAGEEEEMLELLNNPDLALFPAPSRNLEGKFRFSQLAGEVGALDFMVMDEAGQVLQKGKTDEKGNFSLWGLSPGEAYLFKLDGGEAGPGKKGIQLQMLGRYGEELQMIDPDEAGLYVFDGKQKTTLVAGTLVQEPTGDKKELPLLSGYDHRLTSMMDTTEAGLDLSAKKLVIYFEKNLYALDEEDEAVLQTCLHFLQKDPGLMVQIDGHADARFRDDYNLQLSMRRMQAARQYLLQHGIAAQRIRGAYHGESQPANACHNTDGCDDQQNRENRRCEIRLVRE